MICFNAEAQSRRGWLRIAAGWWYRTLPIAMLLLALTAHGRVVSTGTVVANPGATVSVPVTVDDLSGAGAAIVTVGYDSTVLVCLGVDAGTLADAEKMTYLDSGNGRIVAIFSGFNPAETGTAFPLMNIRFSVRDGTQGLFSDVTIADVQFGAVDGVTDLSVSAPVTVVNGMVRVMASDAAAARLEEPFVVWPKTALKALTLADGDGIKASADGAAITVSQGVTSSNAIPVSAPVGGWQTGKYALLTTQTAGLAFEIAASAGLKNATFSSSVEDGVTTYWVNVAVDGNVEVVYEDGVLPLETAAQVRAACADALAAHAGVTRIVVKGDEATIPVTADLGIAPTLGFSGSDVTATYETPTLRITEFDPSTGRVRIKVSPGGENTIRSALATGCIHVYGTGDLTQKMRYISGTVFDLTPYLVSETKGEADLTVSLGMHTLIKVKAEKAVKVDGDLE